MKITNSFRKYETIYYDGSYLCYLEREGYNALTFHVNDSF